MGHHLPKNSKFKYCKDVHVDMEFTHGDKEEELKLSKSYSKLQKDFQEHADNQDRTLDLHFRMFGNILVKYEKHKESILKKNTKHYDYEHELIEKLQNQKEVHKDYMLKDTIIEEDKRPSDSHEERFQRLNEIMKMKDSDSESIDGHDEDEPTIEFYPGEHEFKKSIMDHQKRDLDSLYISSSHSSFVGSQGSHEFRNSLLLNSKVPLSGAPTMLYRDNDDIDNLSATFDEVKTQRNSL